MSVDARSQDPGFSEVAAGASRHQITVPFELSGERLDRALARLVPEMSRTLARKVIGMGGVHIGKKRCRVASRTVSAGDRVTVTWHPNVLRPPSFELEILHADQHIAVVNKPSGQLVAGTELGDVGSLQRSIEQHFGDKTRLMHRLDMGASGIMVAARTKRATASLTPQFRAHTIGRRYLAVTESEVQEGACTLKLRRLKRRIVLAQNREGMEARTDFRNLVSLRERAVVEATLFTGRTHQIRVHLQGLGSPIVGDSVYGGVTAPRLCLHAALLEFEHPGSGKTMRFVNPPSPSFFTSGGVKPEVLHEENVPWLYTK